VRTQLRTKLTPFVTTAVMSSLVPSLSYATPVTFFSWGAGVVQTNQGACAEYNHAITPGTTSSGGSLSCTSFANLTANAKSHADLATGTLKSEADITQSAPSGSFPGFFRNSTGALMGDSFRAFTPGGSPFTWGPNGTATFNFHIDGTITGNKPAWNQSDFTVSIWQPGAIDAFVAFENRTAPFPAALLIQSVGWNLDSSRLANPIANLTTFPADVSFAFTPGGDFDWTLSLSTLVSESGNVAGTETANFFDTIGVTYDGPAGSLTRSASGVFPGTSPLFVPEPSTIALLGMGILWLWGAGLIRRRRDA
jgi:hypothetical protein